MELDWRRQTNLEEPLSLDTEHPTLPVVLIWRTSDGSFQRFTPDRIGGEHTKLWTCEKSWPAIPSRIWLDCRGDRENTHTPATAECVICWDFYSSRAPRLKRRDRGGAVIVGIIPTGLTLYSEPIRSTRRPDGCLHQRYCVHRRWS